MSLTVKKQEFVDAAVAVYGVGAVLNRKQILEVAEKMVWLIPDGLEKMSIK